MTISSIVGPMTKYKFPRGVAKYIRQEKGRIRRQTQDQLERERLVQGVLERFAIYRSGSV